MDTRDRISCPSARCKPGATLLGVVREDGTIGFLPAGLEVDEDFVRIARQGRNPESRFRFADRCVELACHQWKDHHCTIPEKVRGRLEALPESGDLADCAIRDHCRWYRQDGPAACGICPLVITDVYPLDEAEAAPAG